MRKKDARISLVSGIMQASFSFNLYVYYRREYVIITVAKTTATTETSFIRMLSAGPEVSLNGSPTVSPTTAAL